MFRIQKSFHQKAMKTQKYLKPVLVKMQRRNIDLIKIKFNNYHCSTRNLSSLNGHSPNYENGHWSFCQSIPSQTFQFDESERLNDKSLIEFMKHKYDDQYFVNNEGEEIEEKLSLSHKSNTLIQLFEDLNNDYVDNVLQKKIVSQGNVIETEHKGCNIDQWMLFNYHNIDINNGYDANGIVICGLSSKFNEAYQIGPIILNKSKEQVL